ncbi:hypothetical protein QYE76_062022 [Lolium multiflorum]|uniref:K Homology domain-containing protein n=1 Tax=Lolium multiflorum TaxID=4521 RepID=A0AAD8S4W6_LOLMU|nr:hypothetical protein QYE76_062022 [Lolium multiflorum]
MARSSASVASLQSSKARHAEKITPPAESRVPFPYPVSSVGCEDNGPDEHVERYHIRPNTPKRSPDNNDDAQESLTIAIADEHIGAVFGRGGRIKEIIQATSAWVKTTAKGEFMAGTSDREVVICGTREAVDATEAIIIHVVLAARNRQSGAGGQKPPLEPDTTPQQLEQCTTE